MIVQFSNNSDFDCRYCDIVLKFSNVKLQHFKKFLKIVLIIGLNIESNIIVIYLTLQCQMF